MQKDDQDTNNRHHVPVLLEETLELLDPRESESYLDLTAGYGGHASHVLKKTNNPDRAVLVDRDSEAIEFLHRQPFTGSCRIIQQDFLAASQTLVDENQRFDIILADLGISSPHLSKANRGFSIKEPGPLDMRMDPDQEFDANLLVNEWSQAEIARILKEYGEEPKSTAIAHRIVAARPIRTTDQLAAVVSGVWPGRSRVHPATRTFQAIRIAVNDELGQLEKSLPLWFKLLAPGGRLAVISFHSLEDRIVKRQFAEKSSGTYDAEFIPLTKKPLTATADEIASNPRARSAKLRAVVKIKTKRKD